MPRTEGPWRYDTQSRFVSGRSQERICAVDNPDDGRLIAAALDLLEACKSARDYHAKHERLGDGHYTAFASAIAKAEGT
jgi:hypothetical protein